MLKKSKWRIITETVLILSILCLGFGILFLAANCNSGGNKTPAEDTTRAAVSNPIPTPAQRERVNWLQDVPQNRWEAIPFKSNPDDSAQIENEKRRILSYLWAHLTAYNSKIRRIKPDTAQYIIDSFYFGRNSGLPLRYTITAFLAPEVRVDTTHHTGGGHVGGHLIPQEPDPPGGNQ